MQFIIEKCSILIMKNGERETREGIELSLSKLYVTFEINNSLNLIKMFLILNGMILFV